MEMITITQAEIDATASMLTSHLVAAAGIIACNDNQHTPYETLHGKRL